MKERILFWLKCIEWSTKCEINRQKSAPLTYIKICLKTDPLPHEDTHTHTHEQMRPKPQPKTDKHMQTNVFLEYKMLKIATHKLDCNYILLMVTRLLGA